MPDDVRKRCPAKSPGGMTPEGRLPRKGTRCGLDAGHDGDHTVLIPSGAPWWPTPRLKAIQERMRRKDLEQL
jgi:hypothetical protein